ncbi:MAG: hypothetical protein U9R08_01465 [Nanoarchaeota archaeon]|nr:hypothetical protein [Nanoarchaeota archaeon]
MQKEVLYFNNKVMLISSSVFFISAMMILSFLTESALDKVFAGLLPFLLYLILMFFIRKQDMRLVLIAPLIFPLLFFLIKDQWGNLAVVNIIIAYLANALFFIIARNEHSISRETTVKKLQTLYKQQRSQYTRDITALRRSLKQAHQQLSVNKKNFKVSLNSIEDKCKSINFVIGRVYSNKKGGSIELRNSIKIPKELYNKFSELTKYFKKDNAAELLKLLTDIYVKLRNLEKSEKMIFRPGTYEELRLHRNSKGTDKIIGILADNDKDPVKYYHQEAIEVCIKVGDYLKTIMN